MYRKDDPYQMEFEDFYLPFGGKLRSDNRWVVLSKQIPWERIEQEYSMNFSQNWSAPVFWSRIYESVSTIFFISSACLSGWVRPIFRH